MSSRPREAPEGPRVGIVVAAGGSSRLGRAKPLVTLGGETLLARALDAAAAFDETVVVVGAEAARVQASALLARPGTVVVENASWREGMSRSLVAGLDAALERWPELRAAAFFACDQPLVDREHAEALLATHRDGGAPIVASGYGGGGRIPAVFAARFFPELRALSGDMGARAVLERHPADVALVPFPGGELDVDTEEALAEAQRHF